MSFGPWQSARLLIACLFIVFFTIPPDLTAQQHVVSPLDLQKAATQATQTRQHNLQTLQQFFSTPEAEKALKSAKMDPQQVKTAVATLSDEDLAQLSSRAEKARADFAAGSMSDRDLLLVLILLAVIVVIIVAVKH